METANQSNVSTRFDIIFEKLTEAKQKQVELFKIELDFVFEENKTISLFKEYQESMIQSSFTLFTKS